jgi:1-pyrroline-4-hydroxy-2-carboxylate deaminase
VLFQLAQLGRFDEARQLYRWFLPLLDLDVHTKFIHYIKLVGSKVNVCTETVRPPRLPLAGEERAAVEGIIADALANRPELPKI